MKLRQGVSDGKHQEGIEEIQDTQTCEEGQIKEEAFEVESLKISQSSSESESSHESKSPQRSGNSKSQKDLRKKESREEDFTEANL